MQINVINAMKANNLKQRIILDIMLDPGKG